MSAGGEMSETFFVTGATGLLGSNLTRALAARGATVRALVRSREKARRLLGGLDVELVEGDMTEVGAFRAALRGADVVLHAAAYFRDSYKGGSHWEALRRVNVEGTRALLDAAHAEGVRRFVQVSSIAVLRGAAPGALVDETMRRAAADEPDDYYRSKILADEVVDAFLAAHPDFTASFVLPGFMNGPGDAGPTTAGQFVLDFLHRRLPGVLDASFAYVDARDVAEAVIAAAARGRRGERYLAAGRAAHVREAMALLAALSGVPAPQRRLPMPLLAVIALANELWARLTRRPVLVSWSGYRTLRREREAARFDSSKAERELGVRFRPLEETLADAIAWFGAQGRIEGGVLAPAGRGARALPE
ncbi:MAG: SDR family oxidoreductase [Minicystis sp.]